MNRLIIEHIIRQILQEEEFTNLNVRSFADHTDRTKKFVKYLSSDTPISFKGGEPKKIIRVDVLKKGEEKPVEYNPKTQAEELEQVLPNLQSGDKLYLVDDQNKAHSITAVSKTTELGGKGKGSSTKREQIAVVDLNTKIKELGGTINILFNNHLYSDITEAKIITGSKKADFYFVSKQASKLYLSYKHGDNPSGIISYGGISTLSENQDVKRFVNAVKEQLLKTEKGLVMYEGSTEYGSEVLSDEVKKKTLFGSDFKENGNYGPNNVQGIVQGTLILRPIKDEDKTYELTCPQIIYSPNIPTDDLYRPFYNARYASDRSQFGIEHCRFNVIPKGSRKRAVELPIPTEKEAS